ncbi:hypothetical protein JN01_0135 [Entomoplasma freundtii]|uniref:Uncharacterized protein n=1 Tax=Entomoplasma freundtii TaxID=74700 RepID=A0A2K8NSB7_9MOLU|nr:hypothetical protein EFREU_v1c06240 [Entomoplasma freundtii]TDY58189.1 hypothetical protein JN01_0135 [Entomoplasma freundtii]
MNFQIFQKANKKLVLWTGATGLFFLLVSLIIVFLLSALGIRIRLSLAIQLCINALLVWLTFILINKLPSLNSVIFKIATFRHPKTKKIFQNKVILNNWLYLYCFIFFTLIWLAEVMSFYFWTHNWYQAFHDYWWFCLILFIYNYCFYLLFFKIKAYLISNDSAFKKQAPKN